MTFTIEIELKNETMMNEVRGWYDNMFRSKGYFDISLVRKSLDHLGIPDEFKDSRVYCYLHSLHCVYWKDMQPETIEKVKEILYKLVAIPDEPKPIIKEDLV